jgi:hypothetical protein
MSVKFETLKIGDTLYDCHGEPMGNSMCRAMHVWTVDILELSTDRATVSWNGNAAQSQTPYYFRQSRIRRAPPEWCRDDIHGASCYFCGGLKRAGHFAGCTRPKGRTK